MRARGRAARRVTAAERSPAALAFAVGLPAFGPFPALPAGTPMYWASDHAGVVAEIRISEERFVGLQQR